MEIIAILLFIALMVVLSRPQPTAEKQLAKALLATMEKIDEMEAHAIAVEIKAKADLEAIKAEWRRREAEKAAHGLSLEITNSQRGKDEKPN